MQAMKHPSSHKSDKSSRRRGPTRTGKPEAASQNKHDGKPRNGQGRSKAKPEKGRSYGKNAAADQKINLYGLHSVKAALLNTLRRKHMLMATQNGLERLGEDLVAENGISIELHSTSKLDEIVGPEAVHQGLVLVCDPLDTLDASELFHLASSRLVLVLDQITDPHNVGAILRSAVAMDVDAVLVTSRNSAAETAVLAKSASGALDMVRLVQLRNLSKGLLELNDMGFTSVGLDSEGPLVLEDTLVEVNVKKLALVLGSEGKGLRQQTRETCSALARLHMPGPIKSLNVSNAAALSLYASSRHLRMVSK